VTPTHASSGNARGGTEHSVVGVQVIDLLTSNRGSDIIDGVAGSGEGCAGEGKAGLSISGERRDRENVKARKGRGEYGSSSRHAA
jgi:hypothetical protein